MSNLGLKMIQMPVPAAKHGIKCPYAMTPEFLTIHNTANNASALAEISYMNGNWNEVSYHWAVDDEQAIQAIPHNRNAWHCGDGTNGTGNRRSIGIEICYSLTPGHLNMRKLRITEQNWQRLSCISWGGALTVFANIKIGLANIAHTASWIMVTGTVLKARYRAIYCNCKAK